MIESEFDDWLIFPARPLRTSYLRKPPTEQEARPTLLRRAEHPSADPLPPAQEADTVTPKSRHTSSREPSKDKKPFKDLICACDQ